MALPLLVVESYTPLKSEGIQNTLIQPYCVRLKSLASKRGNVSHDAQAMIKFNHVQESEVLLRASKMPKIKNCHLSGLGKVSNYVPTIPRSLISHLVTALTDTPPEPHQTQTLLEIQEKHNGRSMRHGKRRVCFTRSCYNRRPETIKVSHREMVTRGSSAFAAGVWGLYDAHLRRKVQKQA